MTMTHETLVRQALHRATDELAAPVHRLTEQATVRGRRLRRRRRVATLACTLCAVTAIAVPVGIMLGGVDSTTGAPIATDPAPTRNPAQPAPTPTPAPDPHTTEEPSWTLMPATEMLSVLEDHLLPHGTGVSDEVVTNEDDAPGEPERVLKGWLQADLVANGRTVGGINVILMGAGAPISRYTCPGNLVAPDSCTEVTNATGTTSGRQSVTTTGGVTVLEVVLRGPGDGLVYVAVSNSADDKWGAGSTVASNTPPLTLEQVTDIAEDDVWSDYEPRAGDQG